MMRDRPARDHHHAHHNLNVVRLTVSAVTVPGEVRRAGALACAMKDEKQLVPDLIAMLKDPEIPVARAALAALKDLTGKNFGPGTDASTAERDEAVTKWREWWAKQSPRGGVE